MIKLPEAKTLNIVVQESEKETLLYDLENNKAFCLNETCASVWKKCDGTSGIGEIAEAMSKEIGTTVSNDVVFLALEELKKNEIVSDFDGEYSQFDGLSRRDVIRKVGFASMIALPVVSSIVAPKAANAQSATGAVLDQCGAGFPTCGAGLACIATFTAAIPATFSSTGIGQCCSGGSIVSGTLCSGACGVLGCDGQPTIQVADDPACLGLGQVTCMYQ